MPRRHARAVVVGVGLASVMLLATVLAARGWSDDNGVPDPGATWGAPSGRTVHPGPVSEEPSLGTPSAASVRRPVEVARGSVRNLAAGLCLDGRGTGAVLTACSAAGSQQWSYQDDGQLRSVAAPARCLDADADTAAVTMSDCAAPSGQVRYDLTVSGELLLRRGNGRLVAPGAGRGLVVAARDGSPGQRWRLMSAGEETRGAERHGESRPRSTDVRERDDRGGGPEWRRGDTARDGDPDRRPSHDDRHDGDPRGGGQDRDDGTSGQAPSMPPGEYETRVARAGSVDEQHWRRATPVASPRARTGPHDLTGAVRAAVPRR